MYQLVQKRNLTTQLQLQLISTPYHSDIVILFGILGSYTVFFDKMFTYILVICCSVKCFL